MKKNIYQEVLSYHKKQRGKIEIKVKKPLKNKNDLALAYTPGVAIISSAIAKNKRLANDLTNRGNSVAIVTNGTAVLGLGNIGPEAALPVMEGKSAIFKSFANIDAVPLCIKAKTSDEVVDFVKKIEPNFAGINLEDIAAPDCFEIVQRLEKELSIPVFHDDQDGTAIVVLAALINANQILKRNILEQKIVINGAGAAGLATARLLLAFGVKNIIILDSQGTIYHGRSNLNFAKEEIALETNQSKIKGGLNEALMGSNIFIGVSRGNLVNQAMIKKMSPQPIIFAMANPIPEIMPQEALAGGAIIVGTGRSDFPNQINNALVFPGIFRGLLDNNVHLINNQMKIAIAKAIAKSIRPNKKHLLPSITNKKIVKIIAQTIR